jgi:DHA2 family lincomycin resistance protein-like MFS transporter
VLSVGLALVFTPLFTAGLGSLPPKLYSHGSALVGTVQQLAGAVGAALFVALLSWQSAVLVANGLPQVAATAGGIRTAFLCGAILSTFAIAAAFFVKKPVEAV